VAQALQDRYGEQAQIELVDVLADYTPWPLNRLDDIYIHMVRLRGWPWAAGYHLSDGPRKVALLTRGCWPLVRVALLRLLQDHPADVVVCCHPLFSDPVLRTLAEVKVKAEVEAEVEAKVETSLITLVTDLIAAHSFWFVPGITRCLVPTEGARQRALACGLPAERILVTGLPVSPRFVVTAQEDPLTVRRRLGLETDRPVVLLVSGAEGMGPLRRISQTVADSGIRAQLVMVVGRNERLRTRLAAETWPLPVRVESFVHNMHEWMRAANLLITKAGPSTISEALVMGLPIVMSGALPGQERPNVDYVVRAGAGVWAPTPGQVASAVRELLAPGASKLTQMATCAQALARPDAAWRVAEVVWNAACDQGAGD